MNRLSTQGIRSKMRILERKGSISLSPSPPPLLNGDFFIFNYAHLRNFIFIFFVSSSLLANETSKMSGFANIFLFKKTKWKQV